MTTERAAPRVPIIAVTTYAPSDDHRFTLPVEYVESVRRAGGLPVLIAPGEPHLEAVLEFADALILAGGGDIDPALWGGRAHEAIYMVDAARDTMEVGLARIAVERGVPTLGICRGSQIVNVALGGSLIEHLPDVVGDGVQHRLPPREPVPHDVTIEAGSRLAGILGSERACPASWHHQAIRDVAAPLVVVARAPDGTIEAVEHPSHPWLIAVQWHPEITAASDPGQQNLFDALVAFAASHRRERAEPAGVKGIS